MKKLILIILACIFSFVVKSQQADSWRFGVLAGIDFSSGIPIAVSGALNTNEGCASISDGAGNLLFYTDGVSVWNNQNLVMPNGSGLLGGISSTQSALIIPKPGSNTLFYVFTVDEIGGPNGFRYSIVDISLQGGLGDVTATKNVLILNNVTEKLTAFQDGFGNYWIAVHEWGSNAFYVYKLISTGIQAPVITNVGMVHSTAQIQNTYGQMKFSPCGNRLALATGYLDTVQLFEFSNTTGVVHTPITIPFTDHVYGVEFSGNGQRLYVTTYNPLATLVQFDLSSGKQDTIIASLEILSSTPDIYGLQLAPDNKIYAARAWSPFLGAINNPLVQGSGCNYVDNGFDLDPNFMGITSSLGLPGYIQSNFMIEFGCVITGITDIQKSTESVIYPNPFVYRFNLQLDKMPAELFIHDVTGKLIDHFISGVGNLEYGELLKPGVYFITLVNKTGIQKYKGVKISN